MRKGLCLIVLLLAGCATAKQVSLPNGERGYVIKDCDDMAECYNKAAEVCGGKYALLDQGGENVGALSAAGGVATGFLIPQYSITVRCETPPQ